MSTCIESGKLACPDVVGSGVYERCFTQSSRLLGFGVGVGANLA